MSDTAIKFIIGAVVFAVLIGLAAWHDRKRGGLQALRKKHEGGL